MIDHPFLNFKDLSEDELLEKTTELQRNLSRAYMWGSSQDLIEQLQWMLEMVEEEKMERFKKQAFELQNNMFPEIVESEPDLRKDKVVEVEDQKPVKSSKKNASHLPVPIFNKEYINKDKR